MALVAVGGEVLCTGRGRGLGLRGWRATRPSEESWGHDELPDDLPDAGLYLIILNAERLRVGSPAKGHGEQKVATAGGAARSSRSEADLQARACGRLGANARSCAACTTGRATRRCAGDPPASKGWHASSSASRSRWPAPRPSGTAPPWPAGRSSPPACWPCRTRIWPAPACRARRSARCARSPRPAATASILPASTASATRRCTPP